MCLGWLPHALFRDADGAEPRNRSRLGREAGTAAMVWTDLADSPSGGMVAEQSAAVVLT
jgi:hypothetical protein